MYRYSISTLEQIASARLDKQALDIKRSFEEQINVYLDAMYGAQGLFAASQSVERNEWAQYIEKSQLLDRYRGVSSILFAQLVKKKDVDSFIKSIKNDKSLTSTGYPEVSLNPVSNDSEYLIVKFIEPMATRKSVLGFNYLSEEHRRNALYLARDTGKPQITGLIKTMGTSNLTTALVAPVYDKSKNFFGAIILTIRYPDFISAIISKDSMLKNLDMEVYDSVISDEAEIYDSTPKDQKNDLTNIKKGVGIKEIRIPVGDKNLIVLFRDLKQYLAPELVLLPKIVMATGTIISFLLSALVFSLSITRYRAVKLAGKITEDLKLKTVLLEAESESSLDGQLATDENRKILFFNNQFGRMWEMPDDLLKSRDDKKMLDYVASQLKDPEGFINDVDRLYSRKYERAHKEVEFIDGKFIDWFSSPMISVDGKYFGRVWYFRDVTEKKIAEKEKSEFMTIAAHQLRTPLGSMRWNLEMLLAGDIGKVPEKIKEILTQIYESNTRMSSLVNDLLNVSRIEQGSIPDNPSPTQLEDLIDKVISETNPLALGKGIKLTFTKTNGLTPKVNIDPKRFIEVVANLVSNAIKYNSRKMGIVNVGIVGKDDKVLVSVADNGMGIPKEEQKRVFSKFFRGGKAVRNETEGTGLGLFVVKSYIEKCGGKVWFESDEEKGTIFYIQLPIWHKE